jgi:hypothetical protein
MAFPTTGILDNFNRANEGPPPSSNWDGKVYTNDSTAWSVVSNVADSGGSNSRNYWDVTTFGPDSEVYFTIAAIPSPTTNYADVCVLLRAVGVGTGGGGGSTTDAYHAGWHKIDAGSDLLEYYRVDDSAYTQLGSSESVTEMANGHKFGASMIGSTLQAYADTGSGWAVFGTSRTDSTYTAAGYIAILTGEPSTQIDDFGGGTVLNTPMFRGS